MTKYNSWQESMVDVFWGEIAPSEHVVQIYENYDAFLDLLTEYVSDGIRKREGVVVIASEQHINILDERIKSAGFNLFDLTLSGQYIPLNAHQVLSKFMIGSWPDEILFRHVLKEILSRAGKNDRKVRAFGEMVAILWSQGHAGATVQLEHLWNDLQKTNSFSLFCAYPRGGFTQDANASIMKICDTHSKIIVASERSSKDVVYKDLTFTKL